MEQGINYRTMDIITFNKYFGTEEDCRLYLFKMRWPEGFICPHCGHKEYSFHSTRLLYQCKGCKYQASVTAGTIFHKTRTPIMKWFWAIFLMTRQKSGVSAKGLQRMLGLKRYSTAWLMTHKIREAMEDRDKKYKLSGLIEMDESYFGGNKSGKRGRGAEGKAIVAVSVENRGEHAGFASMKVIEKATSNELAAVAEEKFIKEKCTIKTDGFNSYKYLDKIGFSHISEKADGNNASKVLPWVHTLISNAKSAIQGIFHGVSLKHLQRFLDEYCYRFNRRFKESELFDRLVTACVRTSTVTYAELTA